MVEAMPKIASSGGAGRNPAPGHGAPPHHLSGQARAGFDIRVRSVERVPGRSLALGQYTRWRLVNDLPNQRFKLTGAARLRASV